MSELFLNLQHDLENVIFAATSTVESSPPVTIVRVGPAVVTMAAGPADPRVVFLTEIPNSMYPFSFCFSFCWRAVFLFVL